MDFLLNADAWAALITLTALEIVLGIDNIILVAVLVSRLPEKQRDRARLIGLSLAMLTRIALLATLFWLMKLTAPLFFLLNQEVSGRDLILFFGGLFLIYKAVSELHELTALDEDSKESATQSAPADSTKKSKNSLESAPKKTPNYYAILAQIAFLDIIFSLDSVITAVGLAEQLSIMIAAIVLAVGVMMLASKWIANLIEKYPTIKVLALSFLILVGVVLVADACHFHISKGYIYFAMAFCVAVEAINIYAHRGGKNRKKRVESSKNGGENDA